METQVAFGPRVPGSSAHAAALEWMQFELHEAGWQTEVQQAERMGHPIQNVIAKRNNDDPVILLLAHYDSRIYADHDPDPANHSLPVPGANDGASGVAVLLELSRVLPKNSVPIWIVFVDAEDNGDIPDWDWILGARAFAESLTVRPQAVVLLDMVGDADLRIFEEKYSDDALVASIWAQAQALGHADVFIPEARYAIIDDHLPFVEMGIPAVDIIDINYSYWHTLSDTPDKVSAQSLQIVGETLLAWLVNYAHP